VEELGCVLPHIPFSEFIYSIYLSFQPTSHHNVVMNFPVM